MNVMRAFIRVDRFEILGVAHDVVFDLDAVAAVHVAGLAHQPEPIADIERRFGFAVRVIGFRFCRSVHSSRAPSCIATPEQRQ